MGAAAGDLYMHRSRTQLRSMLQHAASQLLLSEERKIRIIYHAQLIAVTYNAGGAGNCFQIDRGMSMGCEHTLASTYMYLHIFSITVFNLSTMEVKKKISEPSPSPQL